jgi:RimJ/RimL family protein N-acetyltransferase
MEIDCGICKVRSWKIEDLNSLTYHANNRKIWLQLRDAFPFPYSKEDAKNFINISQKVKPESFFAIEVGGKAVGSIGIGLGKDIERISGEMGYWLGEEYWGKGIITAAIKHLTQYAIIKYKLTRIFAVPFSENIASCRALEKAGYTKECLMRKSCIKDRIIKDQYLYAFIA